MSKLTRYSKWDVLPKYTYLLVRFEAIHTEYIGNPYCEDTEECKVISAYETKKQADFIRDRYNKEATRHNSPYKYASIKIKIKNAHLQLLDI